MTRARVRGLALGAFIMMAAPTLPAASREHPFVALKPGLFAVYGPTWVNGTAVEGVEHPDPGPMPTLGVELAVPLSRLLAIGAEASVFFWRQTEERELGYGRHTSGALSLLPQVRLPLRGWDLYFALPLGLTFDTFAGTDHPYDPTQVSNPVGFHAGVTAGYVRVNPERTVGYGIEGGFVVHRLEKDFAVGGAGARDEVTYLPIVVQVRAVFTIGFQTAAAK